MCTSRILSRSMGVDIVGDRITYTKGNLITGKQLRFHREGSKEWLEIVGEDDLVVVLTKEELYWLEDVMALRRAK